MKCKLSNHQNSNTIKAMFVISFLFSALRSVMSQASPGPEMRDGNMLHPYDLQDSNPWVIYYTLQSRFCD